jgi:hypothetical protein
MEAIMTQTIQHCSSILIDEPGYIPNFDKSEAGENILLLYSIFDSLDGLSKKLNRLEHAVKRHLDKEQNG